MLELLRTARGRRPKDLVKTEGTVFLYTDRPKPVNNFFIFLCLFFLKISNGNRTEWSPILSVIIRVITKSVDRAAGVRFYNHEYDYRPNWTTRSPITN